MTRPNLVSILTLLTLAATSGFLFPDATTPTVTEEPALVRSYMEEVRTERLETRLRHLASDRFEGRETGTLGQREAAHYLAREYDVLGLLPPPGSRRTGAEAYLQEFALYGAELYRAEFTVRRPDLGDLTFTYDPQRPGAHIYLAAGSLPDLRGPLEYRDLTPREEGIDYDDYSVLHPGHAEQDAVWVLSFAPDGLLQPGDPARTYRSTSTWPDLNLNVPYGDGPLPLGYVLIAEPDRVREESRRVAEVALSVGRLSLNPGTAPYGFPPVYVVTPNIAAALLAGTDHTVESLRTASIEANGRARVPIEGVEIHSHIDFPVRPFPTENVAAYIEGTDPELREEFVVITAHYDHMGRDPMLEGDQIFNGADDNASGNAAMLEIAEAFKRASSDGFGPRRSVAFVHFTGEEQGLLGSRYYVERDPLFAIDETVLTINIDMIGRSDPTRESDEVPYVYVIGTRMQKDVLHDLIENVNEAAQIGLTLDERFNTTSDPNQFYRRSDQWNFGKHGVPFAFFFTGAHEDYHRRTDEADKIDFVQTAQIARLIFGIAWQAANQDERPIAIPFDLN